MDPLVDAAWLEVNVPARRTIDRETQRFQPVERLRGLLAPALAAERVVTYCGAGVAAASDAYLLHRLGHRSVAVYDGSMVAWVADPDLPLLTGDA